MRFNTAISAMMEFVNAATKWTSRPREALEVRGKVGGRYHSKGGGLMPEHAREVGWSVRGKCEGGV